jgi:hypothetical protein
MLAESLKGDFDKVVSETNIQTVAGFELAQRRWLTLYMQVNAAFADQKNYMKTCKKPFSITSKQLYSRMCLLNKLLKLFPREPQVDQTVEIFSKEDVRAWMFCKQPLLFQQRLLAASDTHNLADMSAKQFADYFDDLQLRESLEREVARNLYQNTIGREDRYCSRPISRNNGKRESQLCNRHNQEHLWVHCADFGKQVSKPCTRHNHAHLWKHCPENPYYKPPPNKCN